MIDDALLDRLGDAYQTVRDRYWIPYDNYTKWADTASMVYGVADAQDFMNPSIHWQHPTFEQFVQATLRNRGIWVE